MELDVVVTAAAGLRPGHVHRRTVDRSGDGAPFLVNVNEIGRVSPSTAYVFVFAPFVFNLTVLVPASKSAFGIVPLPHDHVPEHRTRTHKRR